MILDYIENLSLIDDNEDYLFDAQMTLARLSQGLSWLYNSVTQAEQLARSEASRDNTRICVVNGAMKDISVDWQSCAFQWYAVSVCNYVRLVGWLATRDTAFTDEYVKRVIPRVREYRHKVAAHFALTAPKKDNAADLVASIMTNIVYVDGYLRAGAMSEVVTDGKGNEVVVSNKTSWSLTKTHSVLRPRYWPDGPLEAFSSIKVSAGATRKFIIDRED